MRIAIVSDIHGNLTAFEAVLADLQETSPDLILHGGDLADGGSGPAQIVDRIRELGWQGVAGNTDEMLFRPESLRGFAEPRPGLKPLFDVIGEMAAATREALGDERIEWLRGLPRLQRSGSLALVHASPESLWEAPGAEAGDAELGNVYGAADVEIAVFGHIHRPFIRRLRAMFVANTGSVGLPYDGDPRASYLLMDGMKQAIRRVRYDAGRETVRLANCGIPHAWTARMLTRAVFEMP